jgi:ribosomal protein S18 acetylase RimI-like enzyme
MRIDKYKREDLPRLREINDTCFEGLERPPHAVFDSMLSQSEVWTAVAADPGYNGDIKTFEAGMIFGYVIVKREYGAYLWQVAVDPARRRLGVAGHLIEHAEQWCKARGDKTIRLHVHNANPSQKLYFDHGYRIYDLAPGYYGPGTTGLMMKKAL